MHHGIVATKEKFFCWKSPSVPTFNTSLPTRFTFALHIDPDYWLALFLPSEIVVLEAHFDHI